MGRDLRRVGQLRNRGAAGNGTEYFLSSNAVPEANGNGQSRDIVVWSLNGTASLDSAAPSLQLTNAMLPVKQYGIPPAANQKDGPTPLRDCIGDTTTKTSVTDQNGDLIVGCANVLFGVANPFGPESLSTLDSLDSRMQQVTFVNGRLYGALDTALTVRGVNQAGIEYFVVRPSSNVSQSSVEQDGYLGLAKNNLIDPAIGVTSQGKGVMAFTVVGNAYYPSAGYSVMGEHGFGPVQLAAAGVGPQDGFSGYKAFNIDEDGNPVPPFPRWGDYGAAAVDGNTVWIASEYIAQRCTLRQYVKAPFGSCHETRTALGNWATRVSAVQP